MIPFAYPTLVGILATYLIGEEEASATVYSCAIVVPTLILLRLAVKVHAFYFADEIGIKMKTVISRAIYGQVIFVYYL